MAREVRAFAVTTPASTPQATPQVTQMTMPPRVVNRVEIRVPPGPRGEVGFRVGSSGTQLLPVNVGQWIVTDDEIIHWDLEEQHDSGSWEFTSYNTGLFPHTVTVRFLVVLPQDLRQAGAPVALAGQDLGPLPISDQLAQSLSLPLPPPPPTLPPTPTLLPPPVPPGPPGPPPPPPRTPALSVVEDSPMRFATLVRPDGRVEFVVLLSDASLVRFQEVSGTGPNAYDRPPGVWVAITHLFLYQGLLVIRGVGGDAAIWQTTLADTAGATWSTPAKVAG